MAVLQKSLNKLEQTEIHLIRKKLKLELALRQTVISTVNTKLNKLTSIGGDLHCTINWQN
jgi:hypothetical protein